MGERVIRKLGDPTLRTVCNPVPAITPAITKLLDDMAATIYGASGRAGLAAPQVGIPKKLTVMDCGEGLVELINPEIVDQSGEQIGWEACLSIPGVMGQVKRAEKVKVKTLNREGEEVFIDGDGFFARCMQHEIDHLNGILFIDHLQPGELIDDKTNKPVDLLQYIRMSRSSKV